jgi:hypothetical protein
MIQWFTEAARILERAGTPKMAIFRQTQSGKLPKIVNRKVGRR